MKIFISIILCCLLPNLLFAQSTIFQDNFESGNANNWSLSGTWSVLKYNENYVLSGESGNSSISSGVLLNKEVPGAYTSAIAVLLINGAMHLSVKQTTVIGGINRYYLIINQNGIYLCKQLVGQFFNDLAVSNTQINFNTWYKIKIELVNNIIKIYLNDVLKINYTDQNNPIITGKSLLAFEVLENSKVLFDDIIIKANIPPQEVSWIRTGGPLGGIGYDVRVDPNDPNIIFATDQWAGCHKSTDGGATWTPKVDGITSRFGSTGDGIPIFSLTIDPNNSNILWCGTFAMRGVYRSTDKGEHWELRANGIPDRSNLAFRSFCIQPGNSNVVYTGVEWNLIENEIPPGQNTTSRGKIYKTTDSGLNWNEVLDSDALVRTIIIDPTNTNIVYAATGIFDRENIKEEGIWKSTNAGQSWFHINNGITNLTVGHIEMHPINSNILFATSGRLQGFGGGSEIGQILRTTNGGQSWTEQLGGQTGRPFTYIKIDDNNINNVYAAASDRGFYKSTDGGLNWFQTTYNPPFVNPGHIISIATHKSKKDWLITNGYGGGVFISNDGTTSWQASSKGYTGCEITALSLTQDDPLKIFAVARSGIFKSTDGGYNWLGSGSMYLDFNNVPNGYKEMRSVAIHPTNSKIILTDGNSGEINKSTDEGQTWTRVFRNPAAPTRIDVVNQITYSPSSSNIVYAGMSIHGGYILDRPFPIQPTASSFGMLRSTDGGDNWNFINNGLDATDKNIMTITVHPTNPLIVYIGTLNTGIYKSTDGGNNWVSYSNGLSILDVRSIAIDYSNPAIIYAGTQRGGVYKTTNGGTNWQQIVYGMDPEAAIRSIVIDPTNSQIVYAGDWSSGVYRSTDAGSSWFHINSGLKTRAVHKLVISQNGKYLYAGTQGEGVFRLIYEQLPPQINSFSPDTTNVIQIVKGDSLNISVNAFDINDSQLSFSWYFQSSLIPNSNSPIYVFKTKTLNPGNYKITATVANVNSLVRINWNIKVVPNIPATPLALSATNISQLSFVANWNSVNGAVGYYLDVSTDNAFTTYVSGFNNKNMSNSINYSVSGLTANSNYYYRVRSYNAEGTSENSNIINVTTLPNIPLAPLAIAASNIGQTSFIANWNIVNGAVGYYLDVSTTNTFANFINGFSNKDVGNVNKYSLSNLTPNTPYYYRVRSYNAGGTSSNSNVVNVTLVGIENEMELPTEFRLFQNYPNPFNSSTRIKYELPKDCFVSFIIYNILGQEEITLVSEQHSAGYFEVNFDGNKLLSGIYFYRIQAGEFSQTRKMMLLK